MDVYYQTQPWWNIREIENLAHNQRIHSALWSLKSRNFLPMSEVNTLRVLFSLAANLELQIFQLDVTNTFLNGKFKEEVYMQISLRFHNEEVLQ